MKHFKWSILFVLSFALVSVSCEKPTRQDSPPAKASSLSASGKSVKLVIDYGDGVEKHFPRLAWSKDMTVLDAMWLTSKHPRGLRFSTWKNQTGAAAFVEQIDGVENEEAESDAKNWTYKINGKKAPEGAGVQKLKDDDVVVWKFGVYEVE